MTAHKHFKQLVRNRMTMTGESYCSARRHVIRSIESAADLPARWHLPGSVPAAAALRVLLTAAGIRDSKTRQPLSEAMAFGIAGGIGIGVAAFSYAKEDVSSFFVAGRHLWQDDTAYLIAALKRFGLTPEVRESTGAKAAEGHLREALTGQRPCIAFVDMANLPHRAMPAQWSGGGYHVVPVYEIDSERGVAAIGDLTDTPIEILLTDLAIARGRIRKFKNRVLFCGPTAGTAPDRELVHAGLAACHAGLAGRPKKGYPNMFNLEALKLWASRLHGSREQEGWERIFARGHRLWQGLTSIHEFIESFGTGGGLCRPLFAEFLSEAADALADPRLRGLSERYAELGRSWSALASAALPEHVGVFREARELYARRSELLTAGEPGAAVEIRSVWRQLDELQARARTDFPLSETQCAELRAALQERVSALHEAEVAAHTALGALVG